MTRPTNTSPHWVQDNRLIQRILNTFIDKVDSQQQLKMFVSSRQLPELYNFDNYDTEELWRLVVSKLQVETSIVEIRTNPKLSAIDLPYEKARITFRAEHEMLVRQWLNRPIVQPYSQAWQEAIEEAGGVLPNPSAFLSPIHFAGRTAAETVEGFVRVANELAQLDKTESSLSLRTLSARCFWGNSKLLDGRQTLLEAAFPSAQLKIQPRAIMMSAYIPDKLTTALFIENFDSFMSAVAALKNSKFNDQVAVIYSAGFRGSAERIRAPGHAQFVVMNQVDAQARKRFEQWWYDASNDSIACYFWGDLDFSGMAILKAMRVRFKTMQSWRAAYECAILYHQLEARHFAGDANKELQNDPGVTGCEFADQKLLPLMRKSQAFTDQEVVCEKEIATAISDIFSL